MRNQVDRFRNRLERIGIQVTFSGNYPWIYFATINGKKVTGTFYGEHGWTAFFMQLDGSYKFSDRKEVFDKVRSMV
jgi:hypothetical protein